MTTTTITIDPTKLRATTAEMLMDYTDRRAGGPVEIAHPFPGRNARIESHVGTDYLVMDDAGDGEYSGAMGPQEAAELIRSGFARDDR